MSSNDFTNEDKEKLINSQTKLVSGKNIKTINGQDILGGGDIVIKGGAGEAEENFDANSQNPQSGVAVKQATISNQPYNNKVVNDENNIVGYKGYKMIGYQLSQDGKSVEIELRDNGEVYNNYNNSKIEKENKIVVGDKVNIEANTHTHQREEITAITTNDKGNTVITLKEIDDTEIYFHLEKEDGTDVENWLYVVDKYVGEEIPQFSHAVSSGVDTIAAGYGAFVAGRNNKVYGNCGTAFGRLNLATYNAFATGLETRALGRYSFTGGSETKATNTNAFAIGYKTLASGESSLATGVITEASGEGSFASGWKVKATGKYSSALGSYTQALGTNSFSTGNEGTTADGLNSIATGRGTTSSGTSSISAGHSTKALGVNSFAGGNGSIANNDNTFAFGVSANANGHTSISLGSNTIANNFLSFATGYMTEASGEASFTQGYRTKATKNYSSAFGYETQAVGNNQMVVGKYNKLNAEAMFIVGCGNSDTERVTGFQVNWDGKVIVGKNNALVVDKNSNVSVIKNPVNPMEVATKQYVDNIKDTLTEEIKNNLILTDKTTGTNYKVYIDNGKLQLEEVTA